MIVIVRRRPPRLLPRVAVSATVVFATGLVAVPVMGEWGAAASAPLVPPAACPTTAPPGANPVAGFTVSAIGAGVHAGLNSPGLLPTGDPAVGNVTGLDLPLARINASGGPQVTALASPSYPGDTAAHLGTALSTFGSPVDPPNYPVIAEADYPPAPGRGPSVSFGTAGLPVEVASGMSTATVSSATAVAHVASTDLGGAFTTGTADASAATDFQTSCVDTSARATTTGVVIAGVVDIAGVTGYAAAKSDGAKAVPQALLQVGKVTVAGLPAYIDRTGVHLASQQPVGAGVVASVEAMLQQALASSATTISLVAPTTTTKTGAATADSGAVIVSTKHILPGVGHPPQGTPPIPLEVELSYGHVRVGVNATSTPAAAPSTEPTTVAGGGDQGASGSVPPPPSAGSPVREVTPAPPISQAIAPPAAAPGSEVLAASSTPPPAPGSPVPIGWLLMGIVASIIAIGPLLGYARWQLLEGRI
ncbi:MAG: hypothetical protein ACYDH6_04405 [Acidimicrobiales bacterium]